MGKITSQVATLGSVGGLEEDAAAEERVCDDCWATLGGAALGGDEARAARLPLGKDAGLFGDSPRQPSAFVELRSEGRLVGSTEPLPETRDPAWRASFDVVVAGQSRRRAAYVALAIFDRKRAGPHGVKLPQSGPRDERVGACRAFLNGAPTQWLEIVGGAGEPGGLLRVGVASRRSAAARAAPRRRRAARTSTAVPGPRASTRSTRRGRPSTARASSAFAPGQCAPLDEIVLEVLADVSGSASPRAPRRRGALLLTSHRLLFVPEASDGAPFFVPHATCLDVRVEAPPPGSNTDALALCVVTRDFRKFEFTSRTATNRDFHWYRSEIRWRTREDRFHRPAAAKAATRTEAAVDTAPAEAAEAVSEPPADSSEKPLTKRQQRRVALKKFLKAGEGSGPNAPDAGADVDLLAEFRRQGVLDDHRWRLTETNALYALCPTYPSTLVVPAALTDAVLADAARWRSKARVPVLTWYNRASGAPICRSSQPHAGLTDKVMAEDEASLMHLRAATSRTNAGRLLADSFDDDGRGAPATPGKDDGDSDDDVVEISAVSPKARGTGAPVLRIVDCRPVLNAKANAAMGKGHEVMSRLGGKESATLEFLDIANIHGMQESFRVLREALGAPDEGDGVYRAVHDSRWLNHVSLLLRGAVAVADHSAGGDPVLVHCSDGWDRTAQVCGLAQFLLDPYCRTIDGFGVLVEKDWCAFGHMFRERGGGFGSDPQQETGPIFLQFLDAVSQIMWQCPTACEFTEEFLEVLADAERSRWFANFLRDSDRDRARENSGSPRGPGRTPRGAARPRPEENDEAVSIWRVFAFQRDRRCASGRATSTPRDVSPEVAALRARIRALEAERAGDDDGFHDSEAGFHDARAPRSPQLE
ncbi:phosphatidylinositol-3,5-bisphosphate 3-phosphatase [Aureococcus anophagefferens]|nr:phosphatidylinositol-3,5-bisphosphate 3-phosphatase [Aureococcus anophagefferens]